MNRMLAVQALATAAGFEIVRYSGRGMMGKACVSISTQGNAASVGYKLGRALAEVEPAAVKELEYLEEHIECSRTDNLGHRIVVYFPTLEWDQTELDEEEPE